MEYVTSGPLVLLTASGWFVALVFSFYGIGAFFYQKVLRLCPPPHPCFIFIFPISIGMFFLSLWAFICGILWQLSPGAILIFLIIGLLFCFFVDPFSGLPPREKMPTIDKIIFVGVGVIMTISFIAAQAPEIGNDALNYHLYFPKLYVEHARIVHDPTHPRSLWPYFMEMLFTAGLLLQGVALAKLFHWLSAVLCIFLVNGVAAHYFYDRVGARASVVFIALIPAVWMQSLYAYVDNAMMLYTFLSFVALWMWRQKEFAYKEGILSAIFLAALLSVKFFALVPFGILVLIFGVQLFFSRLSVFQKLKSVAVVSGVCAGLSGFWFIRSWFYTGNPVFPFLSHLFGNGEFQNRAVGYSELPKTFLNFLQVPWNISLKPDLFGGEPIGFLFLAALPLLFYGMRHMKGMARDALIFSFIYMVCWFLLIQHSRFLFPIFPFLSLVFGISYAQWFGSQRAWIPQKHVLTAVLLLFNGLLALYYPMKMIRGAVGLDESEAYLSSYERSFSFMKKIKPYLAPQDKILFLGEPRLFYSPVSALFYNRTIEIACQKKNISFEEWLREASVTHFLTRSNDPKKVFPHFYFSSHQRLERNPRLMVSQRVQTADGISYYALWKM